RTFTVVASYSGEKNSGAHAITNLDPNQEVAVSINMLPIVQGLYALDGGSVSLGWDGITGVSGYHIYRSEYPDGPYGIVTSNVGDDNNYGSDTPPTVGKIYYYKISVYYSDKEGELSDYKTGTRTY
ncbi:MAG TPA: hypothetical protein PLT75_11210, partial [Spirochaetota bacterium]|nr:hypothetical protein [Spirochaetota bacterium]